MALRNFRNHSARGVSSTCALFFSCFFHCYIDCIWPCGLIMNSDSDNSEISGAGRDCHGDHDFVERFWENRR